VEVKSFGGVALSAMLSEPLITFN